MKKERKLTEKEQKRKERFLSICQDMEQHHYNKVPLTISVGKANIFGVIIMIPFLILFEILFYSVNPIRQSVFGSGKEWLLIILILIVIHEMINGITWGIYAKNHFQSIDFGVIWCMLTPYCTCKTPLKKFSYVLGLVMPTIVLGFIPAIVAIIVNNSFLFLLAELMTVSGGGDFLIFLKIWFYKSNKKEQVFYDHPYECGVVVYEK